MKRRGFITGLCGALLGAPVAVVVAKEAVTVKEVASLRKWVPVADDGGYLVPKMFQASVIKFMRETHYVDLPPKHINCRSIAYTKEEAT